MLQTNKRITSSSSSIEPFFSVSDRTLLPAGTGQLARLGETGSLEARVCQAVVAPIEVVYL